MHTKSYKHPYTGAQPISSIDINYRYSNPQRKGMLINYPQPPSINHQTSSNYPNSLTMALTRLTCAKNRIPPHAVAIMKVHYWTQGIPWSRHGTISHQEMKHSLTPFDTSIVKHRKTS
jgi:hypothetical protein